MKARRRRCPNCSGLFIPAREWQRFCKRAGRDCKSEWWAKNKPDFPSLETANQVDKLRRVLEELPDSSPVWVAMRRMIAQRMRRKQLGG